MKLLSLTLVAITLVACMSLFVTGCAPSRVETRIIDAPVSRIMPPLREGADVRLECGERETA